MAKSNILGNVLQGIGKGWLDHQTERRKSQAEQKKTQEQDMRRQKELERVSEREQKIYDRNRTNRKADEQESYDLGESRKENKIQSALERVIGKMDASGKYVGGTHSDKANADPNTVKQFEAQLRGDKTPEQPSNPQIADLVFSHKWQEALAASRNNPKDAKFVVDAFNMYNKRNPVARPTTDQASSLAPSAAKFVSPMSSKETRVFKDRIKLLEDDIKDLEFAIENSMRDGIDTKDMQKKLDSLMGQKQYLRKQFSERLQPSQPSGSNIQSDFKSSLSKLLEAMKPKGKR